MRRHTFWLTLTLLGLLCWGHGYAATCTDDHELSWFLNVTAVMLLIVTIVFCAAVGPRLDD